MKSRIKCNKSSKVIGLLLLSKYMIKKYGFDLAVSKLIDKQNKNKNKKMYSFKLIRTK